MPRRNRPKKDTIPKLQTRYVRFWAEGNFETEPTICRLIEQTGEYLDLFHPDGYKFTTHLHNVGRAA